MQTKYNNVLLKICDFKRKNIKIQAKDINKQSTSQVIRGV